MAKYDIAGYSEQYLNAQYRLSGTGFDTVISGLQASGTTLSWDTDFGDDRYQASGTGGTQLAAGSGLIQVPGYYHADIPWFDARYALSGSGGGGGQVTNAGSGLVRNGDYLHAQVGSGLYLQDDIFGVDFAAVQVSGDYVTQAEADVRYAPSGNYEASGTADTKVATHVAESDPHEQYLTEEAASGIYEVSGTADAKVATHEALTDPHPQYLTPAEGNALYPPLARNLTAGSGLVGGGDLNADRTFDVQIGSGLYLQDDLVGLDVAWTDVRYAASGWHYAAGSGLIEVDEQYHTQIGSGLFLGDDEVGFDTAWGDMRYLVSGSAGAEAAVIFHSYEGGVSTTNSNSYVQKLRLTFTPRHSGEYVINWSAELSLSHNNARLYSRVQIDDTTTIAEQEDMIPGKIHSWEGWAGTSVQNLTSGVEYDVDMDWHTSDSKSLAIRRAALTAEFTQLVA